MPAVSEHPQMAAGRVGRPSQLKAGERQKFYAKKFYARRAPKILCMLALIAFIVDLGLLGPDGEGEDEAAADKDGAGMKRTVVRALQG